MTAFELDARLAADTALVGDWPLSRVLLMNDSRFPWLILVPRRAGCTELFDLPSDHQQQLIGEVTRASRVLRDVFACEKINVASLGNIVPQLHVHIVGRKNADAAWPGPVWGFGKAHPYASSDLQALTGKFANKLAAAPILR